MVEKGFEKQPIISEYKKKPNATQSNTKVVETLGPLTPFDRNHDSPIHWFHWSVVTNNKKHGQSNRYHSKRSRRKTKSNRTDEYQR